MILVAIDDLKIRLIQEMNDGLSSYFYAFHNDWLIFHNHNTVYEDAKPSCRLGIGN